MKNFLWILLVLGGIMGVLPFVVSAADPIIDADVNITFKIDGGSSADLHDEKGWLVAGSGGTSTIRAKYTGSVSPQINYVRFSTNEESMYGSVTGYYVGNSPYYDGVFTPSKNRAGNATIDLHINFSVNGMGYDYYRNISQPIDHNTPMKIQSIAFENEVTIDKTMNITIVMEDAYGNAVTSLYEDKYGGKRENVTFETTGYAGSGFYDCDGYDAESVTVPVNAEGAVVATFKAGTEAGPKYLVHVVPNAPVDDKWLTITGIADAQPYGMTVTVVPNVGTPPSVPADGESKFYLMYNLFDRYGNPSCNQAVKFTNNAIGDEFTWRTNGNGQIFLSFGPYETVANYTIHAEAVENFSVAINQSIRFASTSPDDMLLTASPQSMPSADVPNAKGANIYAKVTDECGNGVPGENVSFWIVGVSDSETTPEVPSLNVSSAVTNGDGIATVNFTPGAFEINVSGYESCTVNAMWGVKSRSIDLEWRNYPYLRVETEVDRETFEVGKPVNVTVRLIGDGYALSPDPIHVMLCADRSGSMNGEKIESLINALKVFNENMTEGKDWVGMTSFGGDATLDLPFTTNKEEVESAIDALWADGGTPMRKGLFLAINEINTKFQNEAVKAVILLSDGNYNTGGDPLAVPGVYYYNIPEITNPAEQNLSVYATNHGVAIYSIGFEDDGIDVLRALAKYTGGKYYYASTCDDLAGIYTTIAGELKTAAGVNTKMSLKMSNIELNNVSQPNSKSDPILEYEYVEGESTLVKSWNTEGSEGLPNIESGQTVDQTAHWDANRCLNFDSTTNLSTIQLGQTWQAKFRLIPMKPGNINIFGNGSSISFNDAASLNLPKTYITAEPDMNATGINFTSLRAHDLFCEEYVGYEGGTICPAIGNDLTVDWNLSYSGNDTVTQCLYYENMDDGFWTQFCTFDETVPAEEKSYTKQLYVADFPPGEYKIRVRATAKDAAESVVETTVISIGRGVANYILLE
ncbi:VWA domain-containing protein [Methanogenium marinum]|uniref:VWA domain-containing protein n=1 Tax=Methanogenium marinum TaxID=348610 RepID=A0A9Q4KSM3_9EURY|nr:VWA domain-containing protein [Methanogenium marinum]MDE4907846.1 VWA domain-containing protein [Methanogenium marinum]